MTEEQAILTTLAIRYGDQAEQLRATRYSGLSLGEVCAALNHEDES